MYVKEFTFSKINKQVYLKLSFFTDTSMTSWLTEPLFMRQICHMNEFLNEWIKNEFLKKHQVFYSHVKWVFLRFEKCKNIPASEISEKGESFKTVFFNIKYGPQRGFLNRLNSCFQL